MLRATAPTMDDRIDLRDEMAQRALQDSLQQNQRTNLFTKISGD